MSNLVLVVGATGWLGNQIVDALLGRDIPVRVALRGGASHLKAVARIEAAGGTAVAIQSDVSKPENITRLFLEAKERFGRLDILVNNAGLARPALLEDVTPESIDEHYVLNVKAMILATQAAVRLFPVDEAGVIVNISSSGAKTPIAQMPVYSSSKGAVDVLTRALALELGPRRIRVVGNSPGFTSTEGTAEIETNKPLIDYFVSRTPLGRLGVPSDIADVVAFAVSPDGRWITGETIQVGGGMML